MERWKDIADGNFRIWDLLAQSVLLRNDPLRTPVFGVTDQAGQPHLRTIVLRALDPVQKKLIFYTDARSSKVEALRHSSTAALLFYHPEHKVQVSLLGRVVLHQHNEIAEEEWKKLSVFGRRAYATVASPGTALEQDGTGLPSFWNDDLALEATDFAYANFMVLNFQTSEADALYLHRDGHQRLKFQEPSGVGEWIVP
jgi:hypothetical protein